MNDKEVEQDKYIGVLTRHILIHRFRVYRTKPIKAVKPHLAITAIYRLPYYLGLYMNYMDKVLQVNKMNSNNKVVKKVVKKSCEKM